jgi:serine protease Do
MDRTVIFTLTWLLAVISIASAQTREQKVLADRRKVEAEGFWIYNDLSKGFLEAKKAGKPMLVVLRCIPCEECVKLDDDLINQDDRVRPLLDKFVCVRIVGTNGLDLSLFQFDYDQSFAAFLLNADGTIYGRFGTRSHRTSWADDVSVEGLARALQGALELHRQYPKNRADLAGKKGPAPEFSSPEKHPLLRDKYGPRLTYEAKVDQSCIHCHQIADAQHQLYRDRKQSIPEQVLFPYPHPKSLGLILDPKEKATLLSVEKDSVADKASFQKGDEIIRLEGQPILSIADVQWVLHQAASQGASLKGLVQRGGRKVEITLALADGWRRRGDISWRSSTWGLRRMGAGGLVLENLPLEDRKDAGLSETEMALRVQYVGEFGPHATAKKAGFQKGDILVSFDGRSEFQRETDLLAYAVTKRKPGDRVAVTVLRYGSKIDLLLPQQD